MTPRAKTADYATESTEQALSELTTEVYEDEPGWLVYPVEMYDFDDDDGTPGESGEPDWEE